MFRTLFLAALLSGGAALAADPPKAPAPRPAPVKPADGPAAKPAATAGSAATADAASVAAAAPAIVIPAAIAAPQRALIRVEILLDRAHFSPGVIDGKTGDNLKLALASYAAANGLPADADVKAVTDKLVATDADSPSPATRSPMPTSPGRSSRSCRPISPNSPSSTRRPIRARSRSSPNASTWTTRC